MKTLITNLAVAGTIALLLIVACTREIPVEVPATVVVTVETEKRVLVPVMTKVPVTVEVPVEVTREVTVEKQIPVKHEVEVTREVPVEVTREVHVEKRVLVTYEVEVDREVPVTVEVIATREVPATVEVTREVEVPATVEVTREVPIEVTREIDVTRIVEVPATVQVEVTREVQVPVEVTPIVEITPTAVALVTGLASLGSGGGGGPGVTLSEDIHREPDMIVREDWIKCANDDRITWTEDMYDFMKYSTYSCTLPVGNNYQVISECHLWGGRESTGEYELIMWLDLVEPRQFAEDNYHWRRRGLGLDMKFSWDRTIEKRGDHMVFPERGLYVVKWNKRTKCKEFTHRIWIWQD